MTYAAYEASAQSGRPVELFTFTLGSDVTRYCSAEDQFVFQSNTYYPRQITRTAPSASSEERRQQMSITLTADDVIARRFIGIVPGELMTLNIVRTHRDDPDKEGLVLWDGRITGAAFSDDGTKCILQGLTTEAVMARPIPRFKFQGLCNHKLFDANCTIATASHKYSGTASGVVGSVITVDGLLASKGAGWAVGGYIEATANDWRLIVAQDGDDCTMLLDFYETVVGQTVDVYAGCDHSIGVCNSKFSNTINYLGFPYVPDRNPFAVGID